MAARTLQFKPFQTLATATEVVIRTSHSFTGAQADAPVQVFLEGEIVPGWRIRAPLVLTVERDENNHIISDALFDVYGIGATQEIALEDYIESLIEYYEILARHDDAPTAAQLKRLRTYLQPITA